MSYTSEAWRKCDHAFFDVPFDVEASNTGNLCGLMDEDPDLMCGSPLWETSQPVLSLAQCKDEVAKIDSMNAGWIERRIRKIKNQGREPSCTYNATAMALELAFTGQFGVENWIEFSAMSGYRWNGTPRSGSSVSGAAAWIEGTGLLPVNSPENLARVEAGLFKHTHPATGYSNKFADGWKSTARIFRSHEWLRLTTAEQWFTALVMGYPCVGGRNSHCICHPRPMVENGNLISCYVNSWGEWGSTLEIATGPSKGFGFDSLRLVNVMVNRGAWALRTVLIPPWLAA